MNKIATITSSILLSVAAFDASAQKAMSEGTINYDITIEPKSANGKSPAALSQAKTTIYLKGGLSRSEMTSALGNETTIYNSKAGNAVILKEYSGQKLMITLTKDNWTDRNKRFENANFTITQETKTIQGYNCKKAVSKLDDGSIITAYYAPDLVVMNKDYNASFKNLPGFPVQYELENPKLKFTYSLSKIDFDPVPVAKFDFPKSGYRVMSYDENKQGKKDD